jgi:hypothetical protein
MKNSTNTVTLDLGKYEELTEFKRKIMEDMIPTIIYSNHYQRLTYYTNDKIIKDLAEKYNKLDEKYNTLNDNYNKTLSELTNLKSSISKTKQITGGEQLTFEDVKQMNIWQLIMWKLKNN